MLYAVTEVCKHVNIHPHFSQRTKDGEFIGSWNANLPMFALMHWLKSILLDHSVAQSQWYFQMLFQHTLSSGYVITSLNKTLQMLLFQGCRDILIKLLEDKLKITQQVVFWWCCPLFGLSLSLMNLKMVIPKLSLTLAKSETYDWETPILWINIPLEDNPCTHLYPCTFLPQNLLFC